ncbi:MAG: Ribokinase [Nitrospira sp.]|nr:MAG: Ribokinase [Nitrospira sp.]
MVVVVGSSNIDLTALVDRLPARGETLLGRQVMQSFGGKGANQAVAAARAGATVGFLSKVGSDANGVLIEQHLAAQGLSRMVLLRDAAVQTGVAMILVDAAGDNQIVVVPGSNQHLTPADVRQHAGLISGARVLLVQMEIPIETVQECLRLAKRHGLLTILNPAPACSLPPEYVRMVDVLTPNEREACALSGVTDPVEAAKMLVRGGVGTVVVTRGAEGAVISRGKEVIPVPAFVIEAVDSTGAGDAFNGALACALAEGMPIEAAVETAAAAGALATTGRGAQAALPTRGEIDRLRLSGTRRMRSIA